MSILNISIKNYKSLVDLEINNPAPFTVFVGANASGKSNIFEALDFFYHFIWLTRATALQLFGGIDDLSFKNKKGTPGFNIKIQSQGDIDSALFDILANESSILLDVSPISNSDLETFSSIVAESESLYNLKSIRSNPAYIEFWKWKFFTRIFINNDRIPQLPFNDDQKLSPLCDNLEKVLKRLLKDENTKEEIIEWLRLLVPGLENIEIKSEAFSGTDNLLIYEKGTDKPFTKHLISDGTFNIIAILAAVFQSDQPQFLCFEEPENGLNPKVVRELVGFFREQCKKKGHFIWLNTHSQTLIRELTTEEIILVDKIDGETKIKQIQGENLYGLPMDEALLTNAIGGGIPW
ncbi:MAG: AAA family ATPase [Bacteroidia bacterium]